MLPTTCDNPVDLSQALEWLSSLNRFGIRPGLDRTRRVLQEFGNPEEKLTFYHVAGTNGKGSVCAFLSQILSVNQRVGVFTSPGFDGYRGRFSVQGAVIEDQELAVLALRVKRAVAQVTMDDPLTEFEVLTVMAILYFVEQSVDAVVWETGLGGRFDSTNVVIPLVAAITNVSYDHMEILGNTIRAIAYEKAGIIKPGVPIVTAAADDAYLVIQTVANVQRAPLYRYKVHFASAPAQSYDKGQDGQRMNYRGLYRDLFGLSIPLWGRHQYENASLALAMYEIACELHGCQRARDVEILRAIESVRWPGRFEIIRRGYQPIVLDGAHNEDGARRFALALEELSRKNDLLMDDWTMVIGVLADKEVMPMLASVLPQAGRVLVTAPQVRRAKPASLLAKDIVTLRSDLEVKEFPSVREALSEAWRLGKPIACWGSLYTVDEARKAIQERPDEFVK